MSWLPQLKNRCAALFRRAKLDREMAEEMAAHLERETEQNLARGLPPAEARAAARRAFGGLDQLQERERDARGWRWLDDGIRDMRYALRSLRRSPGFTAVVITTLAFGIGANSAIFSVVYGVLLRPLAVPDSNRLVTLGEWSEQVPGMSISYPNFLDWRQRQTSFTALGVSRRQSFNFATASGVERVIGTMASHDLVTALGVPALRGRLFTADDDRAGAERTVVLGEGFWNRSLGGRESVLGEKIQLSGEFYTIIGVLPDSVQTAVGSSDVLVPLGLWSDSFRDRDNHPGLYGLARLKPGVSFATAEIEMRTIANQLAHTYRSNSGLSIEMRPFADSLFGDVRPALLVLLAAAAFVLLIACANVANLQLARAQGRSREFAIRAALGAGRGRVIRQLLVESLLLGLLGGLAGLALAGWGVAGLRAVVPANIPRLEQVTLNGWVLAFTMGTGLLTGLVFGAFPAIAASRQDLRSAFAAGSASTATARGRRWRSALVVGEFALTCLLVSGAVLMLRTLGNLHRANLGYTTERVLTFDLELSGPDYREPAQRVALVDRALERLGALPGVKQVAVANPLPLRGGNQSSFYVEGAPVPAAGRAPSAERAQISRDYFSTMGIALIAGRSFDPQDVQSSPRVAVVDTMFADRWFPGRDPIGKRFAYGDKPPAKDADWLQIVGVVGHIQNFGPRAATRAQTYVPFTQNMPVSVSLALRTDQDPTSMTASVRAAMRTVSRAVPIFNVRTMDDRFTASIAPERLTMSLLGVFAALALGLAAIGLYGVVSHTVAQRQREIGIRVALGATPRSVMDLVFRQGLRLSGLGLLVGAGTAMGLARLLQRLLYGVSPFDPVSLAAVAGLLAAIGGLACWLPARRASRVDPTVALRAE